jgi:hypothetical protein
MSLQALSDRRVASPPPITVAKINRFPASPLRLWPNLSPGTQAQIARTLAELLLRMLSTDVAPRREMARVDRPEHRR